MGACCGYLRAYTSPVITDPTPLSNLKAKCEEEILNADNPTFRKNSQKDDSIIKPENIKINNNINNYSQENLEKNGTCSNKDDQNSNKEEIIIIKKDETQNIPPIVTTPVVISKISEEISSPSSKRQNLKPANLEHRRDSRSTTSINAPKKDKKNENEAEKKIDINQLKLSSVLVERVQKIQSSNRKRTKEHSYKNPFRSITLGSEIESIDYEIDDKEEEKTKEEINKELKENKEVLEQNHKKITFIQTKAAEEDRANPLVNTPDKNKKKIQNQKSHNKKTLNDESSPKKSLLKRYQTIGNEKEKKKKRKKVQFQDLVDKKKKKKANQKK